MVEMALWHIWEKNQRLGYRAFEREFLEQFGSSPIVNHHGQLVKFKQEGRVQFYIDEFRLLQTMVGGWFEEALIGIFLDNLKPWLSKELKLKQPTRLHEVMCMAKILEDGYLVESAKRPRMWGAMPQNPCKPKFLDKARTWLSRAVAVNRNHQISENYPGWDSGSD